MRLIIVSGYSGAGKSVALHTFEDEGFYCIDNIPVSLLPDLFERLRQSPLGQTENMAIGIDARSEAKELVNLGPTIETLRGRQIDVQVLFLYTEVNTLIRRFSETRRKHPLTSREKSLKNAIEAELEILEPVHKLADLSIDTTMLNLHQLRQHIRERLLGGQVEEMSLLFQSFGFKYGTPRDSDFIFDVRCLPNPHWQTNLRTMTGKDQGVQQFLESHQLVNTMYDAIAQFIEKFIPAFQAENRAYLTVSIGCTGGQHRSVYMAEKLAEHFRQQHNNTTVKHRQLSLSH